MKVGGNTAPIRAVQFHPSGVTQDWLARKPAVNLKVKGRRDGVRLEEGAIENEFQWEFMPLRFSNVPITFEYAPNLLPAPVTAKTQVYLPC